jgi:hypothetical protein
MEEATTFSIFCNGLSFQHLAAALISVFSFYIQLNVTSSTTTFIYLYSIGLHVSTYNVVIIRPTLEQVIGLLCTYWDPNLFYIWIVKCNDLLRGNLLKGLKQMGFAVGSYVLLTKGGVSGAYTGWR